VAIKDIRKATEEAREATAWGEKRLRGEMVWSPVKTHEGLMLLEMGSGRRWHKHEDDTYSATEGDTPTAEEWDAAWADATKYTNQFETEDAKKRQALAAQMFQDLLRGQN